MGMIDEDSILINHIVHKSQPLQWPIASCLHISIYQRDGTKTLWCESYNQKEGTIFSIHYFSLLGIIMGFLVGDS